MPRDLLDKALSVASDVRNRLAAVIIRWHIRRERRAQGLTTDLRAFIAECREKFHEYPEYADILESILYPTDSKKRKGKSP